MIRPLIKGYFRSEVRGLENVPRAVALLVSNHSGGLFPMDVPVFATDFDQAFGYDRPMYTLGLDLLFIGPTADFFKKTGFIRANHENADEALRTGGLVIVFPGGDYDVYRPTMHANTIDFGGRTGYVRAALNAGVPIVPRWRSAARRCQLFLSRGTWLAKRFGPIARLARAKIVPISFGFPFGLSLVVPPNVPLPTKIVMEVLPPIDIVAEFGEDPDVDEVDGARPAHHATRPRQTRQGAQAPRTGLAKHGYHGSTHRNTRRGRNHAARRSDCADAARQVRAHRRGDATRKHGRHIRVRRRRAALPGPSRARRRTRNPDLA